MIIIGYQGIGKSTLANKDIRFIDLESGNFWINGKRHNDWHTIYCNIAEHLSKQGKIVFVSSHEVVRNDLKETKEMVVVIFPSVDLKDQWINKLEERYKLSKLEKDNKALLNAKNRYTENINELKNSGFKYIELKNINYDLRELILLHKEVNSYIWKTKI